MSPEEPSQDLVQLIEYSIVSIEPMRPRVLPGACGRCLLLTQSLDNCALDSAILADYLEHHPIEVPTRYLRVQHRILGSWQRPPLHFEEKQLRRLRGIARAIRSVNAAIDGSPRPRSGEAIEAGPVVLPPSGPSHYNLPSPSGAPPDRLPDWAVHPPNPFPPKSESPELPPTPDPPGDDAPAAPDDLKLINGIGPKIAKILAAAGIRTYADLAQSTPDALRALLEAAGRRYGLADPDDWPEQAQRVLQTGHPD